jgi:geranylgeranyl diphosphate synthase type II
MNDDDIRFHMRRAAEAVNSAMERVLTCDNGAPQRLKQAMHYSVMAGGKRLRPALVLWCCDLCGGDRRSAIPAAMAIEFVHTFSLIHDDLPALDDDDLRRGKPTCHRAFGEAEAILAGDALLALAFEVLTDHMEDPAVCVAMVRELAKATGLSGMIGGEFDDLESEAATPARMVVERIHAAKTARLIEAACRLGGIAAKADKSQMAALSDYGRKLGLAFQAADDLLDSTGDSHLVGKRLGKDTAAGKQTYPRAVGIEESRKLATKLAESATAALADFGSDADRLKALAHFVVSRKS